MFGIRKRLATDGRIEECARQLKDLEQRFDAYAQVIRALLSHLKDFSMDLSDIDGEGFRSALDRDLDGYLNADQRWIGSRSTYAERLRLGDAEPD